MYTPWLELTFTNISFSYCTLINERLGCNIQMKRKVSIQGHNKTLVIVKRLNVNSCSGLADSALLTYKNVLTGLELHFTKCTCHIFLSRGIIELCLQSSQNINKKKKYLA